MDLIEKINYAKKNGYTIKFLAEENDICPTTLYKYLGKNNYNLSIKNQQKLEKYIDSLPMQKEEQYLVYMHINKINNKKYIGLTSAKNPTKRWRNGKGYIGCIYFYNAIQKYGWDNFEHIIIKKNLTKEEASQLEKDLIKQYDTLNKDKGYNCREGGISDYHLTDQQKRKMAWAKGKHFSLEHCQNISKGLKGRTFSDKAKEKMSEAKKKAGTFKGENNPKATKVQCIENLKIFNTITEAANFAGVTRGGISNACRGIQKTSGGYHWKYFEK